MTVKLGSLEADVARETEGDWVSLDGLSMELLTGTLRLPDLPNTQLKVRSLNYPPYQLARSRAEQRLKRRYADTALAPQEEQAEVYGPIMAEHLLLDWRGFDIPYSMEAAREALSNPRHRQLRSYLIAAAAKIGEVEAQFFDDAEKNSARPSAG
jgi:hypothetical protein